MDWARSQCPAQFRCNAAYSSVAICSAVRCFTGTSAGQTRIGALSGWVRGGNDFGPSTHVPTIGEDANVLAIPEASSGVIGGLISGVTADVTADVIDGVISPPLGAVFS